MQNKIISFSGFLCIKIKFIIKISMIYTHIIYSYNVPDDACHNYIVEILNITSLLNNKHIFFLRFCYLKVIFKTN